MHFISKLLTLSVLSALTTQAQLFTNTVNAPIPDGNPTGLSSTIDVEGLGTQLTDITVSLDIAGGFNGDLYAYLSHGGTGFAVLLNRVGKTATDSFGYGDPGFHIILSDAASLDIHNYGGNGGLALPGTWQPDGRNVNPQLVLDISPRTARFDSFINSNPNGLWTLVVADMAGGGGQATLQSWGVDVSATPVPEPGASKLFFVMAGAGLFQFLRLRRVT
jgi:subtilisin-like proprotein convertase family protein